MKKSYIIIILSLILLVLIMLCVSGGFFDFKLGGSAVSNSFSDVGTSNNFSSDWFILPEVTKTVTDNGTIVSCPTDKGIYANIPSTNISWDDTFEWNSPFTVEFDILNWEGSPFLRIIDADDDATISFEQLRINNGSHVKVISTNSSVSYIVDGDEKLYLNESLNGAQIGFRLVNATITYKNFKIY